MKDSELNRNGKRIVYSSKNTPRDIYNTRASQTDFCPLNDVTEEFVKILVAFEDPRFFSHHGIDLRQIRYSLFAAFKGQPLQGMSTIPQQIVKNLYFPFERSWRRKIKEAFMALRFCRQLTKEELLELYINIIYYDNGQYGIKNASSFYFNKTPNQLTVNQSVFLVNILPIDGIYNPFYHPEDFARFRDRKMKSIEEELNAISEKIIPEAQRHTSDCLDEELCSPPEWTKKYDTKGPMINERFGPGGTESLTDTYS